MHCHANLAMFEILSQHIEQPHTAKENANRNIDLHAGKSVQLAPDKWVV